MPSRPRRSRDALSRRASRPAKATRCSRGRSSTFCTASLSCSVRSEVTLEMPQSPRVPTAQTSASRAGSLTPTPLAAVASLQALPAKLRRETPSSPKTTARKRLDCSDGRGHQGSSRSGHPRPSQTHQRWLAVRRPRHHSGSARNRGSDQRATVPSSSGGFSSASDFTR